ncbi:hypothetical protein AB1282_23965 [Gottfriedia sp. S16(2024)]|uniref:hypothetical protein n=1 Tax=Gottfriedia sp. S16(2024) TaxID=3162883 RepID=UPI003D19348C
MNIKRRYKHSFLLLLSTLLFVGGLSNVFANAEEIQNKSTEEIHILSEELVSPVQFNTLESIKLQNLGFSSDEINSMSVEEYNGFKDLYGSNLTTDENYYKITQEIPYSEPSVEEISKAQAINEINTTKLARGTSSKTTGYLKMTTSSSKLSNGNTLLKNSFTWLKSPNMKLTDVVAITHSASSVKIPNTDKFSYKYTDGKGIHSVGATSTTKNNKGIAKKFKLKDLGINVAPYNHNGYLSVEVTKGNKNDITANAYGHYTHLTLGVTSSIDIKTGSIGVGIFCTSTDMDETMIKFNY